MRRGMLWLLALLVVGGCGGSRAAVPAPTTTVAAGAARTTGLRVGVVGPLVLDVQGVSERRGTLREVAGAPLVLADAHVVGPAAIAAAARAHPAAHFALVGASTKRHRAPNLVGLVLRRDQAAYLAGVTAGLAAAEGGGAGARVAWVGPAERALAAAFGRGVRSAGPDVAVLHQRSSGIPARCKEAALTALDRGATVVMARGGLCADAAAAAAHEQNVPALRLDD